MGEGKGEGRRRTMALIAAWSVAAQVVMDQVTATDWP